MSRYERFLGGRIGMAKFRAPPTPAERIIWFPFGGGNSRAFAAVAARLPADWAAMAVDLPGHMLTDGEPLRDPTEICEALIEAFGAGFFEGAILAGHSVGGLIAAHLVRHLEPRGITSRGCVICAARPPGSNRDAGLSTFSRDELFQWWLGNLALDASADGARDLFHLLEPSIRADVAVYEAFDTVGVHLPRTPTLVLCGIKDTIGTPSAMGGWREHIAHFTLRMIEGGHLFVLDRAAETALAMSGALAWFKAAPQAKAERYNQGEGSNADLLAVE
jgi:surfactin synthase thioesterase subunit